MLFAILFENLMNLFPRNRSDFILRSTLLLLFFCCQGNATKAERPWAARMEAFEAEDAKVNAEGKFPLGGVVFVGSSSIRLWDLPKWFPDLKGPVLNRGFGGSQIHHSTAELPLLVLKHKPRVVVFYAGDNDISAGKEANEVEANYQAFISQLHKDLPETKVFFIAIKPSISRWHLAPVMREANERIRLYCDSDERLSYLDIWSPMLNSEGTPRKELLREDGLHLTESGYQIWSEMVNKSFLE